MARPLRTVPLSILDYNWPGHLPELVPAIERFGYHRYWATEHYGPLRSASPVVATSLAAGLSSRLRVGTGGVLLRLTSALRVAQDFALLELYFPGRIDLGIAGATAGARHDPQLAPDIIVPNDRAYEDRVRRVVELVRGRFVDGEGALQVGPESPTRPELWLCGTSTSSARLAGSLGIRFAYHHYLAANYRAANHLTAAPEIGLEYRSYFIAQDDLDAPYLAIAAHGSCARSDTAAEWEWREYFGGLDRLPVPSFSGPPKQCIERLRLLVECYSADELFIDCLASSFAARLRGLRSIAKLYHGDGSLAGGMLPPRREAQ